MADLNSDLRLAIDTGSVSFGKKETKNAIHSRKAKAVVLASKGKADVLEEIVHLCKIAGIRVINFKGNPMELGTVCGKPFSVSCLAISEAGTSNILQENYD
ncbi:MAG: 50S ribosomal protein L30e [Candidatus Micrarchaeia archaeon]